MMMCHGRRVEPDTHTVLVRKEHDATDSLDSLELRLKVDLGIVGKESRVVTAFFSGVKVYHLDHTVLPLDYGYTDAGDFRRK